MRKRGSGIEITKAGLDGKSVGVQRATIHENFLRDNYGDIVSIKAYATQEEANLDFGAGRVDLLLADSLALREGLPQNARGAGRRVRRTGLHRSALVRRRGRDRGAQGRERDPRCVEPGHRNDP